jgi:hypothetical protein
VTGVPQNSLYDWLPHPVDDDNIVNKYHKISWNYPFRRLQEMFLCFILLKFATKNHYFFADFFRLICIGCSCILSVCKFSWKYVMVTSGAGGGWLGVEWPYIRDTDMAYHEKRHLQSVNFLSASWLTFVESGSIFFRCLYFAFHSFRALESMPGVNRVFVTDNLRSQFPPKKVNVRYPLYSNTLMFKVTSSQEMCMEKHSGERPWPWNDGHLKF